MLPCHSPQALVQKMTYQRHERQGFAVKCLADLDFSHAGMVRSHYLLHRNQPWDHSMMGDLRKLPGNDGLVPPPSPRVCRDVEDAHIEGGYSQLVN